MLKILPVQSKEEQKRICSLALFPYDEEDFMYAEYEDDKLIGAALFDLKNGRGTLSALSLLPGVPEDTGALYILGRAVLNFMDLCHTEDAYCACVTEENEKLMRLVGFAPKDGDWYVCLRGFFTDPCKEGHCH